MVSIKCNTKEKLATYFSITCTILLMKFQTIHAHEMLITFWAQESNPKMGIFLICFLKKGNSSMKLIGWVGKKPSN